MDVNDDLRQMRKLIESIQWSHINQKAKQDTKKKWWHHDVFEKTISLFLLGLVTSSLFYSIDIKTCPTSYDKFLPIRGQCYQFRNASLTWSEAKADCVNRSGFLLELYTAAELEYVNKLLEFTRVSNTWLGASDHRYRTKFRWNKTEKEVNVDTTWASGFPSFYYSEATCLLVIKPNEPELVDGVLWINTKCESLSSYVCKVSNMVDERPRIAHSLVSNVKVDLNVSTNTVVANISSRPIHLKSWGGKIYNGGSNIYLISSGVSKSWADARSLCQSHGMDLIYIDTELKWSSFLEESKLKLKYDTTCAKHLVKKRQKCH